MGIPPSHVHDTLRKHLLADGFDLVCDLEKSRGCWLYDAKRKQKFLDMFTFFATLPLGFNHPKLSDSAFVEKLGRIAINKVSNSDVYTAEFAEAVESFSKHAVPKDLPHLFFIDGGALAVENALKAAFDWKVRKNFARGSKVERGHKVIHFRHAFHGRSGYTLSLTNTADPRKYQYFPRFNWPRIDPPTLFHFAGRKNKKVAEEAEKKALGQIISAIESDRDEIAALIIEPIQAEGGDNHFRPEFFQSLRNICTKHELLLIFDEVQTGFGLTGKMWAYEHFGVVPDLLAFGKKAQVCGLLCGKRIDEVEKNVFSESSRINSTFGGNLVDIVRAGKILEIIREEELLEKATKVGRYLLERLIQLEQKFDSITNARGLGLMCAIDFPTTEERNRVRKTCYDKGMIILPCGTNSIRFRPNLAVTTDEIDQALKILGAAISSSKLP